MPDPQARSSWRLPALLALVIALAYSNGLTIGFHFDDWHALQQNPFVRSLANLPRFFVDPNTTTVLPENKDLRPILLASFALNHAISGDATWSYHVLNLILHWLAALLVFRIVRDHLWLGEERFAVAAAAALVVAAHPLNTEPLDYLSARSALLATVFYLGAFDAGVRGRRFACVLLFTLALGLLAWRARRRWPALTFAALWYVVTLAAESTIFPLAEPVNEHRPYLAMLGLGTAAGLGLWQLARFAGRGDQARAARVFAGLLALVTAGLAGATFARNRTWADDYTLWRDATEKAPQNPRAWLNAGHAAMTRGEDVEARRMFLEAHRLSPCYAYVQMNLSALEARHGAAAESLAWADEAVHCNSGLALIHHYRGAALERLGRTDEALEEFRQTTTIDDQHVDAWMAQ